MVSFSCDGCNEVLKKSQVDAHANRCRNCYAVSCVDCLVSFPGDDYRAHTSCMTEAERYEKKTPSAKASEKVTPQQHWMNAIASAVDRAPPHLRNYVQTMSQLDNVPRKEKQFRNFTANSLNLRGNQKDAIVSDIWNLLKAERERQRPTPAAAAAAAAVAAESSSAEAPPTSTESTSAAAPSNECRASNEASQTNAEQTTSNGRNVSDDDGVTERSKTDTSQKKKKEESVATSGKKEKKEKSADATSATKKTVKKAIRSILKECRGEAVTLKALRKAVRAQLKLPKNDAKQYVAEIVSKSSTKSSSSFVLAQDGKSIRLKV